METSRSDDELADSPEAADINVAPTPTPTEAAAIAAAIQAHLDTADATAEADDAADWWRQHAWRLQGRFTELRGADGRPAADLPRDPWRAAERSRRL